MRSQPPYINQNNIGVRFNQKDKNLLLEEKESNDKNCISDKIDYNYMDKAEQKQRQMYPIKEDREVKVRYTQNNPLQSKNIRRISIL